MKVPDAVGVPLITPVAGAMVREVGSAPEATAYVYPLPEPPEAVNAGEE